MAEIFGAVASGAGLMSLAVQLLESSQKLKSFYNASRDAPQTIADLSFELETISLSLRQLVIHRQADISNDTLLVRCMTTCTLMTTKIEDAVKKMEHLLRKSRGIGRMYSAFKEPEIFKLLEGLEHAKSSMLFAYMGYCQSWNLRQAALRAAEAQSQNALLSTHEAQLQNLSLVVQSGHASILERIETTRSLGSNISAPCASTVNSTRQGLLPRGRTKNIPVWTLRLALPRWLARRVWEFAVHESNGAWNFRVRPINIRPYGTFVFDIVRSGNVEAVKKLLTSGELSVSDREDSYNKHNSLLCVAARYGRLELCEFLLHEHPTYYSETDLCQALDGFLGVRLLLWTYFCGKEGFDELLKAFYTLFIKRHGVSADLYELVDEPAAEPDHYHRLDPMDLVGSNPMLTDDILQDVIMSQTVPLEKWHPYDRFCAAVNARGWPAGAFLRLVGIKSDIQFAPWVNGQGKTALHWAAEHFGYWMSHPVCHGSSGRVTAFRREYGELCTTLIAKGADPNALNSKNETPFTSLIRPNFFRFEGWSENDLCDAVVQWGQHVQDAGVSLHAYAMTENRLQSRYNSAAYSLRIDLKEDAWTCKLVVSETLTLAIEVGFSFPRPLWQYRPPPGTWRRENYQPENIGWRPEDYFEEEDCALWQILLRPGINFEPELIRPRQPSLFRQNAAAAWQEWATGIQDDHGFICRTLQQLPGTSKVRCRVRRAASLPPPITMLEEHRWRRDGLCFVTVNFWQDWLSDPHKCPLDLKWKSAYRATNDDMTSRRRCMLGRCDDGESDLLSFRRWEVKLLDDESNIEIARRFTDRFRPEWRSIVEENHIKRRRRAELGMSTT